MTMTTMMMMTTMTTMMMMTDFVTKFYVRTKAMPHQLLKSFVRRETGSLSVEAVFAIPILVWAICATFVFFDAFRTQNQSQKATYTLADMLSREEAPVNGNYLTAMHELFDKMTGTEGNHAVRATVVMQIIDPDTDQEETAIVWSEGVGINRHESIDGLQPRLPNLAVGEQLIVIEGVQEWTPVFKIGPATYRFREVALARPRFAPQLCWEDTTGCVPPGYVPPQPVGSSDDGALISSGF